MHNLKLHKAPYLDAELSFISALAEGFYSFSFSEMSLVSQDVAAYYDRCRDPNGTSTLDNGDIIPNIDHEMYWLVENDDTFIGQINLRIPELPNQLLESGGHIGYTIRPSMHGKGYGTKMLSLLLKKIDKTQYKYVLITCEENNFASRRVIEKNGGILQDIITTKYNPNSKMCRYHILL